MSQNIITFLIVILTMMMITVLHELAHFSCARFFNVKVKEFACGVGPGISICDKNNITWKLGSIPLLGYVAFADKLDENDNSILFDDLKPMQRFLVAFAGPLSNIMIGLLLFTIVYFFSSAEPNPFSALIEYNRAVLNKLFSSEVHNNLRSPISLFSLSFDSFLLTMKWIAKISVGIGIMNLLPFLFVLDGGHMLIYLYEYLFGLSMNAQKLIEKICKIQMYLLTIFGIGLMMRDVYYLLLKI